MYILQISRRFLILSIKQRQLHLNFLRHKTQGFIYGQPMKSLSPIIVLSLHVVPVSYIYTHGISYTRKSYYNQSYRAYIVYKEYSCNW